MSRVPLVSVVIPAYQEAATIGPVVEKVRSVLARARIAHEVVVIDDGSTDGGGASVAARAGVSVIVHPYNLGYGASLKTGIAESRGAWIAIVDADDTYPVESLPLLIAKLEDHAMAVGARPAGGGGPPIRRWARSLLRRLSEYLAGRAIPDLNSGMRAFRRSELEPYLPILPAGFSFTTTSTLALLTHQRPVAYVPIAYSARVAGRSKIRPVADTFRFLSLIVRVVAYFDPLKVLLPLAGAVFAAGFVEAVFFLAKGYGTEQGPYVSKSTILLLLSSLVLFGTGLLADLIVARTRMLLFRPGGTRPPRRSRS